MNNESFSESRKAIFFYKTAECALCCSRILWVLVGSVLFISFFSFLRKPGMTLNFRLSAGFKYLIFLGSKFSHFVALEEKKPLGSSKRPGKVSSLMHGFETQI